MCSTNHSNWVTFEDDNTPPASPQKPLQSPGLIKASVPRPNGLKLVLPPIRDTSWSFNRSLKSPQSHSSPGGSSCEPCNMPFCTPVSGIPSTASPFHFNTLENNLFQSFSSTSTTSVPSPAQDALHQTSDGPSSFPSYQGNSGHYNPFWDGSRHCADVDSSSSDSESDNSLPRFFIRTKDGSEPPRDHLQSSFFDVCQKLDGLRAETKHETETEKDKGRRLSCKSEVLSEGSSPFVPRGLFRSQKRDGWSVMLRIPEKKNRMSSRQWGPIYLRLLPGGVLQMYYEKGLEKPYKEFQLLPQCRLSDLKLENYGEPRNVLSVKVEHFSYTEKKRYHPKLEVSHEAEAEELLKFGSTVHDDMEDLVVSMEEEIFKLSIHHQQRRHYEEQELSLQITDHIWVRLDTFGEVMERTAFTQIHCLAFLNRLGDCFLALNDLGLLRFDSSYGSEEDGELWMEIADCHFHKCVNETEFQRSRLIKFSPPEACRVELMRYKTEMLGCTEIPFSIKAVVTVQGAYVELQAFLNMSPTFLSSVGGSDMNPLCENVVIRVPVPGDWVKVTQTVALLRQRSLKARMNRKACLGAVSASDSQPVMQVTIGTVKYENVYSAVVWRIDRLPAKNTAVDHPHSFSCKLELGSDQEIPSDWYPFMTMECEIMGAVVSQTRVKSLGTANDIQPQKHVTSWTRYHCQAKLYLSIIYDVIESIRELFLDEGLEDRVLDDLRHLWESKMMQSKAMEDLRKNTINSSNFVLQLPANYSQTDQELPASVVVPASHSMHSFPMKNNSETLATFSLPAGLTYPVQIPAGVTLQTASGQLYKVNVPVVVTQAPAGQLPVPKPTHKVPERREAAAPQSAAIPPNATHPQEAEPPSVPAPAVTQPPHPEPTLPPGQEISLPQQQPVPAAEPPWSQGTHSPEPEVTLEENEPSPQPEPLNLSMAASPCSQLLDFQICTEEALTHTAQLKTRDIDEILKEVIEEEREKAERARNLMPAKTDNQSEAVLGLDLDYSYSELSDIVQLDGPAGNSDVEEEEEGPLEENDFLGIINAEAIKALQEGDGSSDGNSISSTSDSEGADELANVEEEDPLNSGDDVIEQDIPDLFDTDNVIVCQYDKIHRSKNRWKFHLKDGVMCYGGRDYVFSKAVGEAEW
ncbi:stonin-1 [Etheostoma cragini]|uniref:stonin-1 n=1 Tax=Etheostoma cragini TaxID=417921 RepID=UPI00155E4AD5|nr:stonin-1 [Etheostoma cragini]